jgi:MoxR-like ATPase
MEERQITVDAVRYTVPAPFMVLATQNPIDLEGTYRLPEAQLDRFLMRIAVGYPEDGAEEEILTTRAIDGTPRQIGPVTSLEDVRAMIGLTAEVHVAAEIAGYIVAIAKHTRRRADLRLGVSPRGSLALLRAAQAHAAADGRSYVVPDDVKTLAPAVLAHRLLLTAEAEMQGGRVEDVLADVLSKVPVPKGAGLP